MKTSTAGLHVFCLILVNVMCYVSSQRAHSFTDADKANIVRSHNILRSSVSPAASNMREMVYSDELAAFALKHAETCAYGHSDRDGENIFSTASSGELVVNLTSYIVDSWGLRERRFYDYEDGCQPGKTCGHYTQIIWAETNSVGCGAAFCPAEEIFGPPYRGYKAIYLVCNYGPAGNGKGQQPYKSGTPCSDCPSGFKKCNQNLCSDQSETAIVQTPHYSQEAFCFVDFFSLRRLGSHRVKLEFTSSGPVRSHMCTFNRSYPKTCYSGEIFWNVPRGLNKIKVTPIGCGISDKRDAVIQF